MVSLRSMSPYSILSSLLVGLAAFQPLVSASPSPLANVPFSETYGGALHRRFDRDVNNLINNLVERQAPSPTASSAQPASTGTGRSGPKVDPAVWNKNTQAACMKALTALNGVASGPSGIAVCYNLPTLNNETGAFQADLRLYRIAPGTGAWAGVSDGDVSVNLNYKGASAAIASDGSGNQKRAVGDEMSSPKMLQGFNFIGQINEDVLKNAINIMQLQSYLSPNVTLAIPGKDGKEVTDTLSSMDTSFVNGVVSQDPSACGALACTKSNLNPNAKFVLPGTKLEIFPTGLILTLIWTFLGCGAVGAGTLERVKFREQYRRRKQRGLTASAGQP